jgi:hypothetical protein
MDLDKNWNTIHSNKAKYKAKNKGKINASDKARDKAINNQQVRDIN